LEAGPSASAGRATCRRAPGHLGDPGNPHLRRTGRSRQPDPRPSTRRCRAQPPWRHSRWGRTPSRALRLPHVPLHVGDRVTATARLAQGPMRRDRLRLLLPRPAAVTARETGGPTLLLGQADHHSDTRQPGHKLGRTRNPARPSRRDARPHATRTQRTPLPASRAQHLRVQLPAPHAGR